MKTFKEWWNSPLKKSDPSLLSHRECAEQAWNFAYEMQEDRISNLKAGVMDLEEMCKGRDEIIEELREELKLSQQKHLDSIRALRKANEQLARDNAQLLYRSVEQDEPAEERAVKYIATVNEVCEDEADAFYMGTLDDIMEWCEDWNHCINDVKFYRLGDEVRVSFVDIGKETRFGGK